MKIEVREYGPEDVAQMRAIWNEVVEDGLAFPQTEGLGEEEAAPFFAAQTTCGVAVDEESGQVCGLYILHPNNVGRCGHLCNTSYAVREDLRGRHIGEELVRHSLKAGAERGFRILQFNAVVRTNESAIRLYEKLGFVELGVVPGGFLMPDGHYEDIVLFYHLLFPS